jgi:hypothetical protein
MYSVYVFTSLKQELVKNGSVRFAVRVRPDAPKTKILEVMDDESIKIAVAAPADKGKANAQLIKFLASEFGVTASQVSIVSGKTNRHKLILIKDLN